MNVAETLGRCPLFKDFTGTGLQILATIANERRYAAGTPIFTEEMQGDALYVVVEGRVRISLGRAQGHEQALGSLGPGEFFGELSLLGPGSVRLVSAVADDDARLLEIRQRDFVRLQTQKPQACLKLVLAIAAEFGRKLGESRGLLGSLLVPAARR